LHQALRLELLTIRSETAAPQVIDRLSGLRAFFESLFVSHFCHGCFVESTRSELHNFAMTSSKLQIFNSSSSILHNLNAEFSNLDGPTSFFPQCLGKSGDQGHPGKHAAIRQFCRRVDQMPAGIFRCRMRGRFFHEEF
jgi:hypothetical protein